MAKRKSILKTARETFAPSGTVGADVIDIINKYGSAGTTVPMLDDAANKAAENILAIGDIASVIGQQGTPDVSEGDRARETRKTGPRLRELRRGREAVVQDLKLKGTAIWDEALAERDVITQNDKWLESMTPQERANYRDSLFSNDAGFSGEDLESEQVNYNLKRLSYLDSLPHDSAKLPIVKEPGRTSLAHNGKRIASLDAELAPDGRVFDKADVFTGPDKVKSYKVSEVQLPSGPTQGAPLAIVERFDPATGKMVKDYMRPAGLTDVQKQHTDAIMAARENPDTKAIIMPPKTSKGSGYIIVNKAKAPAASGEQSVPGVASGPATTGAALPEKTAANPDPLGIQSTGAAVPRSMKQQLQDLLASGTVDGRPLTEAEKASLQARIAAEK